jgi:hypothetical protein
MTSGQRLIKYTYRVTLLFLTLTGFGQMPIFKRYYIADIPGLAWLAQFYVTHALHYFFAALLIALVFYTGFNHLFDRKEQWQISAPGIIKSIFLGLLIVSGGLMVMKNFTGTPFSPMMISMLDLTHMALCMGLLFYSLYTAMAGKRWLCVP